MTTSKYPSSKSFFSKTRIVLVFLGILPLLLVVYIFYQEGLDITDKIIIFAALALFSILTGFTILRDSSDQLISLSKKTSDAIKNGSKGFVGIKADQELKDIADNFNVLLKTSYDIDQTLKVQSVQLLKYAEDLARSYERLKKEEKVRDRLSRYVEKSLVEKMIRGEEETTLKNERKDVTVLFADIRSFTRVVEGMDAQNVVSMLNEFFNIMVDIIFRNNGVLDKFIGDQLMAVFGPLPSENNAPYDAVKSAAEMQDATKALMNVRRKQNKAVFEIGIGINTGLSILGNVGAVNRMDYTVIGDSVNVAARLQQLAKGGEIIIGEQTYRPIRDKFRIEKKVKVNFKHKKRPIICYYVST
jgi:class 3 adenylate cyclase